MDQDWAIEQLEAFIEASTIIGDYKRGWRPTYRGDMAHPQTGPGGLIARTLVAEKILNRVTPGWRPRVATTSTDELAPIRDAAQIAIVELRLGDELNERLGGGAGPRLSGPALHPWVWDAARSLWQSRHYREAVRAASVSVNAHTQTKVDRRDTSETDLFKQSFSDDPPTHRARRLRPAGDDGGKTALSHRRGIRAFAEGCYAGIRNPASHDEGDLDEQTALEQLAAFSVLARWVDGAEVISTLTEALRNPPAGNRRLAE